MSNASDFVIENGILTKYVGPGGDVVIPDGVTTIGKWAFVNKRTVVSVTFPAGLKEICEAAFQDCKSLRGLTLPDGVEKIGIKAFCGCDNLASVVLTPSLKSVGIRAFDGADIASIETNGYTIGPDFFGAGLPKRLAPRAVELMSHMNEAAIKAYVLSPSCWRNADTKTRADIVLALKSKPLRSALVVLVQKDEAAVLGEEIAASIPSASEDERDAAAWFAVTFRDGIGDSAAEIILSAAEQSETAAKTVKSAAEEKKGTRVFLSAAGEKVRKFCGSLTPEELTRACVKLAEDMFSIRGSSLPKIKCKDGSPAEPFVLPWLLTANEKKDYEFREGGWSGYGAFSEYNKPGCRPEAAEVLAELDHASLQKALLQLASKNLGGSGRSRKMLFAFPFCRYADEETMEQMTKAAPSWASRSSGRNAPPLRSFTDASVYSETVCACVFAEKYGAIDRYAALRGVDTDTVRDMAVERIIPGDTLRKEYDLGGSTVFAHMQSDFSFIIELPDGKTAKTLPKRGSDPDKLAAAQADLSKTKKDVRKIVRLRYNILFEHFLNKRSRASESWRRSYLQNELLKRVASLIVWSQKGKTFIVSGDGLIDVNGNPYSLSPDPVIVAHPMEMNPSDVEAWRGYFLTRGQKQPFRQMWEPVCDLSAVRSDMYAQERIPFYRFWNMEKHGIFVSGDRYNGIDIRFTGCGAEVVHVAGGVGGPMEELYQIKSIAVSAKNRRANHIIAYLDRITVYGVIRRDDMVIAQMLPNFTAEQIADFINVATDAGAVNVTALLLDYYHRTYPEMKSVDLFNLDL